MTGEIASLGQVMAGAAPEKMVAVVAILDRLPERGVLDQVIDPVREALGVTLPRPPRQPTIGRVLALPFEPLLVPPLGWRGAEALIPRSILPALTAEVSAALGPARVAEIEARLAGVGPGGEERIAAFSPAWQSAAWVLSGAAAGGALRVRDLAIPEAAYRRVLGLVASLLGLAPSLMRLGTTGVGLGPLLEQASKESRLRIALIALRRAGTFGAQAAAVHAVAASAGVPASALIEAAYDAQLADLAARPLDAFRLRALPVAGQIERVRAVVAALEALAAVGSPRRVAQLRAVCLVSEAAIRARFIAVIEDEVIAPFAALGQQADDTALRRIEACARLASMLSSAGAALGGSPAYQQAPALAASRLAHLAGRAIRRRLRVAGARVAEILGGADEAERCFGRAY